MRILIKFEIKSPDPDPDPSKKVRINYESAPDPLHCIITYN